MNEAHSRSPRLAVSVQFQNMFRFVSRGINDQDPLSRDSLIGRNCATLDENAKSFLPEPTTTIATNIRMTNSADGMCTGWPGSQPVQGLPFLPARSLITFPGTIVLIFRCRRQVKFELMRR